MLRPQAGIAIPTKKEEGRVGSAIAPRPGGVLAFRTALPFMRRNSTVIPLGGIAAVALVLRLVHLGSLSFWLDEASSVYFAQLPWPKFFDSLVHDEANMAFYYLLLRPWLVLGSSEFMVRSLSVVFSVATIPLMYVLGARMFGTRVGLVGALLVALHAYHIRFAQEARSYSLLVLLLVIATLSYVAGVARPSRRIWIAYTVASILSVYSHFFALFVLPAQWFSLILLRPKDVPWKALLASAFVIGLFIPPLAIFIAGANTQHIVWIPRPTPDMVPRALVYLAGAAPPAAKKVSTMPEVPRRLLLLAYFALGVAGLSRIVQSWKLRWRTLEAWHYGLVLSWLCVPFVLVFGISLAKPILVPYYLIICLPPLVLIAAIGLSSCRPRWIFLGILIAVVGLAGHTVLSYYRYATKEDWRDATRYVLSSVRPGDAIALGPFAQTPFAVYRDLMIKAGGLPPSVPLYSYKNVPDHVHRVWLVTKVDEARVSLTGAHALVHTETFEGAQVLLYRAR